MTTLVLATLFMLCPVDICKISFFDLSSSTASMNLECQCALCIFMGKTRQAPASFEEACEKCKGYGTLFLS